jgi:hypothetical protein
MDFQDTCHGFISLWTNIYSYKTQPRVNAHRLIGLTQCDHKKIFLLKECKQYPFEKQINKWRIKKIYNIKKI